MKKMVRGELTAFLSLIFLLLLTLVGAVLESASIQVRKNEKRADAGRAVESVFAEYQRDLLERYEIFAVEGSYESGEMSEENILNRLSFYGAENMEIDIGAIRYLTDQNGQEFFRQAVEYEKKKTGISMAEEILENYSAWKEKEKLTEEYGKEDKETSVEMEQILQEGEESIAEEENPFALLKWMKSDLFLDLVLPENFELSDSELDKGNLVTERSLREGYGTMLEKEQAVQDTIFFNLYLMEKFGNAQNVKDDTSLKYELEYLLGGNENDRDNLEETAKRICNMRFAVNYAYLLTDQEKQMEAELAAGSICALLTVPGIIPVIKQGLLLAWAYGEGMMDVRALLSGKAVPFVKTAESWKLSLENVLDLKETGLPAENASEKSGFDYEKYLQMLLMGKSQKTVIMRALNLVEENIKSVEGKEFFRVDTCITGANFQVVCPMRRNIEYRFEIAYQYH